MNFEELYATLVAGDALKDDELGFLIARLGLLEENLNCLGPKFALAANEIRRNLLDCRRLEWERGIGTFWRKKVV